MQNQLKKFSFMCTYRWCHWGHTKIMFMNPSEKYKLLPAKIYMFVLLQSEIFACILIEI